MTPLLPEICFRSEIIEESQWLVLLRYTAGASIASDSNTAPAILGLAQTIEVRRGGY